MIAGAWVCLLAPLAVDRRDRDLGIRLKKAGARFAFSEHASVTHRSDHTRRGVWLRRAFLYGVTPADPIALAKALINCPSVTPALPEFAFAQGMVLS